MQTADMKQIQERAEAGDVRSQVELGKLRSEQNRFEDAASWFRMAAEQNDIEAQMLYGKVLSEGVGVDQDQEAAAYWLRQSAESGCKEAQVLLAQSFESGTGVPVNHSLAAQWYLKAAQQGDVVAQYRYGQLLLAGDGVEKNLTEAAKFLRQAADAGNVEAMVALVECWVEQDRYDLKELMDLSHAAAQKGSAQASYRLGWAFETAPPRVQSIDLALDWYRHAAELGSTNAQIRLGTLYTEGKIVPRNAQEAERWLSLVVSDGNQVDAEALKKNRASSLGPNILVSEYSPGTVIEDKYFILSLVGRGGMCMVYKAKHLFLNRMVALKMLLPESASNQNLVDRFYREAHSASSLSHPNIVTIHEIGKSPDGKPFMVMDYLEGDSLEERIETQGRIAPQQAVQMFMQVCAALDTAHEASIIHRDIKPSNIMLIKSKMQPDVVKVVDFGLAKVLNSQEEGMKLTKTGEVFGTLLYMSPEQCLGHPLDVRTDIYSVGCSMYEAITGVPVHRGSSAYELMSMHINKPAPPFQAAAPDLACPSDLEAVVLKTLQKNREDRYQSMAHLYDALSKVRLS
jgi:TPR repeat protein